MTAAADLFGPVAYSHVYRWGRPYFDGTRKGHRCRVVWTGGRNSTAIVFEDGTPAIVSRYAVRRATTATARTLPADDGGRFAT